MISFFRKYQKFFFFIIAIVIIVTFVFFGTYSTLNKEKAPVDKKVSSALDGTDIKQSQINALNYFLSLDSSQLFQGDKNQNFVNVFNTGFLNDEFFDTGLMQLLINNYWDDFKEEFAQRLERIKSAKFYSHPAAPFISAKEVWKRFAPEKLKLIEEIQKTEVVDIVFVKKLIKLYQSEQQFSSYQLKNILFYLQNQYSSIPMDEGMYYNDMSLFGFKSLSDWFSQECLDLMSQYILNVACVAKTKGYKVSYEEAYGDLLQNVKDKYKQESSKEMSLQEAKGLLDRYFTLVGVNKNTSIKIWENVLLFKKYFSTISDSIIVDKSSFEEMADLVFQKVDVEQYVLPQSLKLNSFKDLMKLSFYIKTIGDYSNTDGVLQLPSNYLSLQQLEKKCPQLTCQKYLVKLVHANIDEVGVQIGEKDLWQWQTKDYNWNKLQNKFPAIKPAATAEERFVVLENLDRPLRIKVDAYSRKEMSSTNIEYVKEFLQNAKPQEVTLKRFFQSSKNPYKGLSEKIFSYLDKLSFEEDSTEKQKEILEKLSFYTEDQNNYFSVELLEKDKGKNIVEFIEAKKEGILDELLDNYLKEKYSTLASEYPAKFLNENGNKKELYSVYNEVGRYVFNDLLKALDDEYIKNNNKPDWKKGQASFDFYVAMMQKMHLENNRKELLENQEIMNEKGALFDQWILNMKPIQITKDSKLSIKDEVAKVNSSYISQIKENNKEYSFFKVVKKEKDQEAIDNQIKEKRKSLTIESKMILAKKILDQLDSNKCINIQNTRLEK